MSTFSERLKSLRLNFNLRQKDVADRLGISESAYGYYEQGRREPSNDTLKRLAEIFDVSTDYLLGITNDPKGYINISYDGGGLDIQDEEEEEYLRVQLAEFRKMRERMKKRLQEQQKKEQ